MRSGTTLLGRMLNSHHSICIGYTQTNFLRLFGIRYEPINVKENQIRFLEKLEKHLKNYGAISEKMKYILEQNLSKDAEITFSKMYKILMKSLFGVKDNQIWGEKYAGDGHDVEFFLKLFPKGKIIGIIRDPRAVYISNKFQITEEFRDLKSLEIIRNWKNYVDIAKK